MNNNSLWPGWGKWVLVGSLFVFLFVMLAILSPKSPAQLLNPEQADTSAAQKEMLPYTSARQSLIEGSSTLPWMISGSPKASLTIVEITDFTCPHCRNSFPSLAVIRNKYSADTRLVLRSYTADIRSVALALAGHCAGEQGRYWEMAQLLFDNQSGTLGNDLEELVNLAGKAGVNIAQFRQCLVSKKYLENVKIDTQAAVNTLKISGTPTWYFNGQEVPGEINGADMGPLIDSIPK